MTSPHPTLESLFACDDQSALLHNFVTSENPPPGAWSHHATPQSALGKFGFPLVLTIARGELYTRRQPGVIVEQMLDRQQWLPWAYDGANDRVSVARSIALDLFHARVQYNRLRARAVAAGVRAGRPMCRSLLSEPNGNCTSVGRIISISSCASSVTGCASR